jgi:PrcB C-terminal
MNSRFLYLVPVLAMLAACGGTTMRVAQDDTADSGPVALTPEPEAAPDSMGPAAPASTSVDSTPVDTTSQHGYVPYGSAAVVPIRRIGQWTHTGINEKRRLVIRDANGWAAFWSELGTGDRPAVDFTRDLVVAVAAGQQPSGGHEIAVENVSHSNGELRIEVVETSPGPNCMTTAALTQPVDVVVLPGVNAQGWSFVERQEVRGCR